MCGIVGIIGKSAAAPVLVDALKKLEYRGYDSAGIATLHNGVLDRRRAVGKLSSLVAHLEDNPIEGIVGIGHTRWATHGAPTVQNAHPHSTDRVAAVHNGIIENFRELRRELEAEGAVFTTETDTETVVQLCSKYLSEGKSPSDAVSSTLARLEGAFALCFIFTGADDLMIAARKGSPLAIGYGDDEMFVGSDALALAPMTNRICYLEEGDWACITRTGAQIFDSENRPANRALRVVNVSSSVVDKGEHRHFMAKEMHEQPIVVGYTQAQYQSEDGLKVHSPDEKLDFANIDHLSIIACGTAYYAGMVAKYWFEQIARLPVEIDVASEFRYREPPMSKNGAALVVSQSGETADTLAALRYCIREQQTTIAVVNVPESSIARESDIVAPTLAGPEIGVASTKAFTCQLMVLANLVVLAARQRGLIDADREAEFLASLREVPRLMGDALKSEDDIAALANEVSQARDVLYLGRGTMFPMALEGALKLKEISYIHAEGYASGELKHGPIALIDEKTPVVVMAPSDALFDKTISNMQEVMARGGKVLVITDAKGAAMIGDDCWKVITMPDVDAFIAPMIHAIPVQMLAYHVAVAKGTDVDQPRNLAKSVTVE